MPFKVRCKLVDFIGDVERFPCHFEYKIGDEFIYDGEKFIGRICSGIFSGMIQAVTSLHRVGNLYPERAAIYYSGASARDPSMKKYDGIGWRSLRQAPEGTDERYIGYIAVKPPMEPLKGLPFVCPDARTAAFFRAEPFDLANKGDSMPYYRREMAILDKIKAKPGMTPEEVLAEFTEWERDVIYPPLVPYNTKLFMDELAMVGYIEYRDGKAYPKSLSKQKQQQD